MRLSCQAYANLKFAVHAKIAFVFDAPHKHMFATKTVQSYVKHLRPGEVLKWKCVLLVQHTGSVKLKVHVISQPKRLVAVPAHPMIFAATAAAATTTTEQCTNKVSHEWRDIRVRGKCVLSTFLWALQTRDDNSLKFQIGPHNNFGRVAGGGVHLCCGNVHDLLRNCAAEIYYMFVAN